MSGLLAGAGQVCEAPKNLSVLDKMDFADLGTMRR